MRRLRLLIASLSVLVIPALAPASALAWSPFDGIDCGAPNAGNSAVCSQKSADNTQDPLTGKNGVLLKIADLITILAGVAAVIMLILGGLRFVQSGGQAEDIKNARRTITYALVGLLVIVLSRALVGYVLGILN